MVNDAWVKTVPDALVLKYVYSKFMHLHINTYREYIVLPIMFLMKDITHKKFNFVYKKLKEPRLNFQINELNLT